MCAYTYANESVDMTRYIMAAPRFTPLNALLRERPLFTMQVPAQIRPVGRRRTHAPPLTPIRPSSTQTHNQTQALSHNHAHTHTYTGNVAQSRTHIHTQTHKHKITNNISIHPRNRTIFTHKHTHSRIPPYTP